MLSNKPDPRAGFPDLLTTEEVASVLRVSERTVRRWGKDQVLDRVKVGGTVRYTRDSVRKAMGLQLASTWEKS